MTNTHRLAIVRAHLCGWLNDQIDSPDESGTILSESIVIRDEFYCGRSFDLGVHRAIWFIEEDELKIHDENGQCVAVFQGEEICAPAETDTEVSEPNIIKLDTAAGSYSPAAIAGNDVATANEKLDDANENQSGESHSDDDDIRRAA